MAQSRNFCTCRYICIKRNRTFEFNTTNLINNYCFRYYGKKFRTYYDYNRNIDHVLVDQVLKNLKEKKLFNSNIIKNDDQVYLHNNINEIKIYKGNLKDSDICFIEKI